MKHTTILRTLIAAEFVSLLLGTYADYVLRSPVIRQTHGYLTIPGQEGVSTVFVLLLAASCVAWAGLWFFQRWARLLYSVLVLVSLIVILFQEPAATPPFAAMFFTVSTLASGVILGLVWFSDLRSSFERRP